MPIIIRKTLVMDKAEAAGAKMAHVMEQKLINLIVLAAMLSTIKNV